MLLRRSLPSVLLAATATLLAVTLLAPRGVAGVAVELHGRTKKCFIAETPPDTLTVVHWELRESDDVRPAGESVDVTVFDPTGVAIMQRTSRARDKAAFTSQVGGEHEVCFAVDKSVGFLSATPEYDLEVDIETGVVDTADYDRIARDEHLNDVELLVRKLTDRLTTIKREQDYQRSREAELSEFNASTSSRVVWWSVVQTAIVVAAGAWQIQNLRKFFRAKKGM